MAPLFIPCNRLSHVYSPLSSRSSVGLPGDKARNVPFVRPCQQLPKPYTVVMAVSDNFVEQDKPLTSTNGSREHVLANEPSPGMLSVHGGERQPRLVKTGELP